MTGVSKGTAARRRTLARTKFTPRPGNRVIANFDSQATRCGCTPHFFQGVACTVIEVTETGWLRCLCCGKRFRKPRGMK